MPGEPPSRSLPGPARRADPRVPWSGFVIEPEFPTLTPFFGLDSQVRSRAAAETSVAVKPHRLRKRPSVSRTGGDVPIP